ncbi:MAG: formate--tetrahydrofolate ligase [Gemmatimonadales bacterium]
MRSDVDIAQEASLASITEIAAKLGLAESDLELFGRHKAKVRLDALRDRESRRGRLVLVTGTSPTPAGEGKTTVAVGLADALSLRDKRVALCLREPSLGPVFGIKGGAAGGGYSQVVPMVDINLHFTGDFHAITSAHSLLSAMLDNHLQQGNPLDIDPRRITWKRAVDMNDRALRRTVIGLGGTGSGVPREDGFLITAASEVMAIFCLAADHEDLEARLGRIIVGYTRDQSPVLAQELEASGAMTLLLNDALSPNLVQTLEGTPAFIHGGPFANIAHGCNSLIATRVGVELSDVVVTEAGFGADLGAEKFFDIKCRVGDLEPEVAVVVSTIRSLKMNGGMPKTELEGESVEAVRRGIPNLEKHVDIVRRFGVPPIVALNRFHSDTESELAAVEQACEELGVAVARSEGHARGGEGMLDLADAVLAELEKGEGNFAPLYPLEMPLAEKIETVAREVYGADGVDFQGPARTSIERLESIGLRELPVCIAKTQYSLSDDPALLGRPEGFRITVRNVTPSAGAGFVVALTGDVLTMPGRPKRPAAAGMSVDADGRVVGLF